LGEDLVVLEDLVFSCDARFEPPDPGRVATSTARIWLFRGNPDTDSRPSRTRFRGKPDSVPEHPGHRFRGMPDAFSLRQKE
jgi:hypothetical protein